MATRQAPLTADIHRQFQKISRDVTRRVWKALQAARAQAEKARDRVGKSDGGVPADALSELAQRYHVAIEDVTYGQHDLSQVVDALRRVLDSLADSSDTVRDALHGYFLNTIVLYAGDEIGSGCFAGGMADYEQDQCRLYIAAGRLLEDPDTTLSVGQGRHNVAKDFRSIIAHEIGHLVMLKFEDLIGEKFRIIYDSQPKEYWEKTVSTYAGTDDHELFGESFAAWTHPDYVDGMLPSIIEDVMRGTDMMKFEWPKLRKITANGDNDNSDSPHSNLYQDKNNQGDVTITTSNGAVFTTDMIETILDSVGGADWVVLTGAISPALRQAFADAGYSELVAAGVGTDSKMFGVSADAAEKYASTHSADLVTGLTDTTRERLRGTIEDAVKEGWDRYELQDEIGNNFSFGEYRSGLIAKNELALAYGRGRVEAARSAGAVGKRWLLSSDHDPKEDCSCSEAAEAGVVDFDESFVAGDDDYFWAPSHVSCVFSGATFAPIGALHQMVRAWYDGPAITIEALGMHELCEPLSGNADNVGYLVSRNFIGEKIVSFENLGIGDGARAPMPVTFQNVRLTVGPEHPVLTRRGFVKAKFLSEGDEILYDSRVEASSSRESNLGKIPLIEDAFTACLTHLMSDGSVPAAAHYFHGDEKFVEGKVEVVRPTRHLLPVLDASTVEQFGKCALVGTDMSSAHVAGCRTCQLLLERMFSAARSSVSGGSERLALSSIGTGVPNFLAGANGGTSQVSSGGDGHAVSGAHFTVSSLVDSGKLSTERVPMLDAFPPGVEHLQVLAITGLQEITYVGYCYDASTESGVYAANGLLVKNCQCDTAAVYSKDDEDDSEDDDSDADKMAKYESTFDETMEWLNGLTENQWGDDVEKFDQSSDAEPPRTDYQDEIEDEDVVNDIPPDDELKAGEEASDLCAACLPAASQGDTVGLRITGRAIAHTQKACSTYGIARASEHRTARDLHFEAEKHYRGEVDNTEAADAHHAVAEKHIEILRMIELDKYDDCDVNYEVERLFESEFEELAKYSDDQPRDAHGKWTEGGEDSAFKHDGKQWTGGSAKENSRLNALKVPPAWKNVRLNPDPHGDKQAMGVDKKGRTQAIYSADFRAGQDAAKFERLKEFNKVVPQAVDQLRNDMNNTKLDAGTRDAAAATYLISQTGIRIGSHKETGADKQAYGASTLEGRHVKVSGDTVSLNFTGKKGVDQSIRFKDPDLAAYLGAKGAKRSTPVFGATTDAHIRDYFHKTIGDQFVVKDFRTWTGTATALRTIAGFKPPKTETDYKKAVKAVAKTVSEKLGNTPAIALKSYIDPTVFKAWRKDFKAAA